MASKSLDKKRTRKEKKAIMGEVIQFPRTQYLKNIYKVGNRVFVSGKFENFNGLGQIAHPDYVVKETEKKLIPLFQPIYPLFFGINQKFISKIINQGIKKIPIIPEWLNKDILIKYKFPNWHTCISLSLIHIRRSRRRLRCTSRW